MQKRLSDLFGKPISGEWGTEASDGTGVNVLRSTNFSNIGKLDVNKEVVVRDINEDKIKTKQLKVGDLIIEKSGGSETQPVGRVVYFDIGSGTYLCNNFTSILRPKSSHNPKFLLYLMLYLYKTNVVTRYQNKTTGIINLKLADYLEDTIVEVPSLDTQNRIADALDKVQELIDKRKQQIEKLDDFLRSVFLNMFGDPMTNPKGWDVTNLGNLSRLQGGYAFKSRDYQNDGVRLVRITNVHRDFLEWSEVNYLPVEYHSKYEPYALADGDILMAMTRPIIQLLDSVKVVKVTSGDLPCLLNQRVGRFIITDRRLSREYLYWFCLSNHFKNEIERFSSVSLQPNVSSKQVEEVLISLPPLALQETFADIVDKVVIKKQLMEQGLVEMQNLFNSIMQRAFKGELFN